MTNHNSPETRLKLLELEVSRLEKTVDKQDERIAGCYRLLWSCMVVLMSILVTYVFTSAF